MPFFLSSRGYGMFIHTTTPITCDFGKSFSALNSLAIGDDELDLFIFLGEAETSPRQNTRSSPANRRCRPRGRSGCG